ncbi:hypothetical protein [Clostridium sp.]|uniref:hypothetical protein n=1 Tax=Clostridium sp. TaxID=1506 RepID=UPI0026DB46D0|nr:hypothetical protein [Clostridium sp.]MDO5038709.1 hypothetical protein [Clostridium sp.]
MGKAKIKRNRRLTRREKYIRMQKRRRTFFILILSISLITVFTTKKVYAYIKCQDISSAVEYIMTSNIDNALLRVQTMKLKFSDGNSAVVEISGLSKNKPHESLKVECHLKYSNNHWKLENSYLLK